MHQRKPFFNVHLVADHIIYTGEKQRRRIEELERRAAIAPIASASASAASVPGPAPSVEPLNVPEALLEQAGHDIEEDVIDPSLLSQPAAAEPSSSCAHPSDAVAVVTAPLPSSGLVFHRRSIDPDFFFLSAEFDRWLQEGPYNFPSPSPPPPPAAARGHSPVPTPSSKMSGFWSGTPGSCSCPGTHTCLPLRIPHSYRPVLPSSPSIYANTLRIDMWCILSGMLENCLHLGISKATFCADDSQSPFFRITSYSNDDSETIADDDESQKLIRRVRSIHGAIKYDLRPIDAQILHGHHPYIDILPFRDLRQNLIAQQRNIDEDEFLLDFLNNATCWGGVRDAGAGTGCPWDGRSWEANENFLEKWWDLVGGEDGELTRTSRWWREMRGERVTEAF